MAWFRLSSWQRAPVLVMGFILLATSTGVAAPQSCENIFVPIDMVKVENVIRDLARLKMDLDLSQALDDSEFQLVALRAAYRQKSDALVAYLNKHQIMTREALNQKMQKLIEMEQATRENVENSDEEDRTRQSKAVSALDKIDGSKIVFQSMGTGRFETEFMRGQKIPHGLMLFLANATINEPFEIAATQTTQVVWRKVVEAIQEKYKRSTTVAARLFGQGFFSLKENPSAFKGDLNPVEQVSYADVQLWLSAVNELSRDGNPIINELFPGHERDDQYSLPTEIEREFAARAEGKILGDFHSGEKGVGLGRFDWNAGNSSGRTHSVATLLPLEFNGKRLYDIHGNVREWTQNQPVNNPQIRSIILDPEGLIGTYRTICGGSFAMTNGFKIKDFQKPTYKSRDVGFRIIKKHITI